MDTVLSPLTILFANLLAALMLAIVKDVVNNVWWGETQLVLQRLSITPLPDRPETPHVEITGRRAGPIGYLLTLFEFSPTVSLTACSQEVRKSSTSLNGHSLELIPLSENVSVQADSQRSLVWLAAALSSLTAGVASALVLGEAFLQQILDAIAWLLVAGVYLFAYYQSHRFQIVVHGTLRTGVSFKPGVLEGRAIRFEDLERTAEALMSRIQASRGLLASGAREEATIPISPIFSPSSLSPLPFIAPAVAQHFDDSDETLSEPVFPPRATPAKKAQIPDRSNTGTVEYGEDQPAFEESASYWSDGLEPGTSDSIQLRQSLTRSVTSLSLGASGNLSEYEEADLDDRDTDSNISSHRGTVSWEEHADKTQDEMRAEAELADLKRSRPKRGEARLRLRELMRRFPQTEAANKARRMLERLEAGE